MLEKRHRLPTPGIAVQKGRVGVGFDGDLGSWQGRSKESAVCNSESDRNEVMRKVGHLEPALEVSLSGCIHLCSWLLESHSEILSSEILSIWRHILRGHQDQGKGVQCIESNFFPLDYHLLPGLLIQHS